MPPNFTWRVDPAAALSSTWIAQLVAQIAVDWNARAGWDGCDPGLPVRAWKNRVVGLVRGGWGAGTTPLKCVPPLPERSGRSYVCGLHTCAFCHARRAGQAMAALSRAAQVGLDAASWRRTGPRPASLRRTLAGYGPAAYSWEYPVPGRDGPVRTAAVVLVPYHAAAPPGAARHGPATAGGLADAVRAAFGYPVVWAAASAVGLAWVESRHVPRGKYWAGYGACRAGYAGFAVGVLRRPGGPPVAAEFPLPRKKRRKPT